MFPVAALPPLVHCRRSLSITSVAILILGGMLFSALAKAGSYLLDKEESKAEYQDADGKQQDVSAAVRAGGDKA